MTPNNPFHLRLHTCHRCPKHDGGGHCTAAKGRDIVDQANEGTCPLKMFEGGTRDYFAGMIGIAKAVARIDRAEPATIARRRVICRGCPESIPSAIGTMKCRLCGCQLWAKTTLKDQKCPAGKW